MNSGRDATKRGWHHPRVRDGHKQASGVFFVCRGAGCAALVTRGRALYSAEGRDEWVDGDGCGSYVCSESFKNAMMWRNRQEGWLQKIETGEAVLYEWPATPAHKDGSATLVGGERARAIERAQAMATAARDHAGREQWRAEHARPETGQ